MKSPAKRAILVTDIVFFYYFHTFERDLISGYMLQIKIEYLKFKKVFIQIQVNITLKTYNITLKTNNITLKTNNITLKTNNITCRINQFVF